MGNNFHKLPDDQLVTFIAQAVTAFNAGGDPNAYGLSAAQITALNTAGTSLNTAIVNAAASEAAYHGDIQAKLAARQTALDNLALCANIMYATPGVTNEMVANAGFQPRDTERTPIVPVEPLNLVVSPSANGTVLAKWDRNGNPQGVVFMIETSSDGLSWSVFATTSKRRVTLDGFEPGVAKWFRVKATHRGLSSTYSNLAVIYGPGEEVQLEVAA